MNAIIKSAAAKVCTLHVIAFDTLINFTFTENSVGVIFILKMDENATES